MVRNLALDPALVRAQVRNPVQVPDLGQARAPYPVLGLAQVQVPPPSLAPVPEPRATSRATASETQIISMPDHLARTGTPTATAIATGSATQTAMATETATATATEP